MAITKPTNTDDYIATFPPNVQKVLQQVRATIRKAAPGAKESFKYAIPTFEQHGNLVHFAAFKNHIGFYALPTGNEAFKEDLADYKQGKGSIQFPLDKPIPLDLITRMVKFRVKENEAEIKAKKTISN
jgi:uncharacterized protein YdhG (YjbR/CyaY superfamily)